MEPELLQSIHQTRVLAQDTEVCIHQESLLNIPIVRAVLADTNFSLVRRQIDSRWSYGKYCADLSTGFQPFRSSYFYGTNSAFSFWLDDPFCSARRLNRDDRLVLEVLFMVHDYLHSWAYRVIDRLWPELDVFRGPITSKNFDDFLFCHLLSETAATVGLDYWCLARKGVNQYCPIGSLVGALTTGYRDSRLEEYRRFNSDLDVQNPAFFANMAGFYCTGELPGFGAEDLRQSPLLLAWLEHELMYGKQQRIYSREWLAYMSDENIHFEVDELARPIRIDEHPMRQRLICELGHYLWDCIQHPMELVVDSANTKRAPSRRRCVAPERQDFRFTNCALIPHPFEVPPSYEKKKSQAYLIGQILMGIPFESFPKDRRKYINLCLREGDVHLLLLTTHDLSRFPPAVDEPEDLFMLS